MTKKHKKQFLTVFLLNIFTIGVLSGGFSSETYNSTPKSSDFDDTNATIVCYFENNLVDTNGHSLTSNSMSFTSSSIEGSYSAIIDGNTDYARWSDTTDYTQGTIEFIFNPDTVSLDDNVIYYLYSGGDGTYPTSGMYLLNGTIRGYHYSANYQVTPRVNSTTVLEPNQGYHIAYSFGPTGTHLYVNGIEENSTSDTRVMHPGTLNYGIGKTFSINPEQVSAHGVYDMFRFSNIQRTTFPDSLALLGETPIAPNLYSIDSPDEDGDIDLSWDAVLGANSYNIYRYSAPITEINGSLTNVNSTLETTTQDLGLSNGTYYYAVTALNASGESLPSNCVNVVVSIPPLPNDYKYATGVEGKDWIVGELPAGFTTLRIDDPSTDTTNFQVISNFDEHENVLQIYDPSTTYNYKVLKSFPTQSEGFFSGFIGTSSGEYNVSIEVKNSNYDHGPMLYLHNGQVDARVMGVNIDTGARYNINELNHFVIEFNLVTQTYHFYWNGEFFGTYGYYESISYVNLICINTWSTPADYYAYIDAIIMPGSDAANPFVNMYPFGFQPNGPILDSLTSPDDDGDVPLSWSTVPDTDYYNIYRYDNIITDVNSSLTLVNTTALLSYQDLGLLDGSYYYAITAMNESGESLLSNCESVDVIIGYLPDFDDASATIVCYFENNFDDTHGHSSTSNGMSFTTSSIEGSYSALIDGNTDYARWSDTTDYTQGTIDFLFTTDIVSLDDNIYHYLYSGGDGIYPTTGLYLLNGTIRGFHYSANYEVTPRVNSTTILESNHRYHIAYSFGPTGTHLYVNGIEEDSTADTRVMHPGTLNYGIGKTYSLSPQHLTAYGKYDMFRFSNIQRTSFPNSLALLGVIPYAPNLQSIYSPDEDGNIYLSWDDVGGADSYKIYRYNTPIIDINETITLVTSTVENYAPDLGLSDGIYYYVITALNENGESLPSNCESVEIAIPQIDYALEAPTLYPLVSPDEDGTYNISWTSVVGVEDYMLFRDTSIIVKTEGLSPIYIGSDLHYQEINITEGIYYYCVIATNSSGFSPLSNVVNIVVSYANENPIDDLNIPGFPIGTLIIFIGLTLIGLKKWTRKYQKNH